MNIAEKKNGSSSPPRGDNFMKIAPLMRAIVGSTGKSD